MPEMKHCLAAVAPIVLALACTVSTPSAAGSTEAAPEATRTPAVANTLAAGRIFIRVFYTMAADENMAPIPVARTVPETEEEVLLLHSALQELVKGPTDDERAAGLTSWFSHATAEAVTGVAGGMGDFAVDFTGLDTLIPNASTSAGSYLLLSQLNSTVFQFDFVQTVNYTLDGDCAAFWEWLQMDCHPVRRTEWEAG